MAISADNKLLCTQKSFVERMLPRHYRILDLVLLGKTAADIERIIGMSRTHISRITNSATFQHELALKKHKNDSSIQEQEERVDNSVAEFLQTTAMNAAKTLASGLKNPDARIQIKSAVELLDRTGFPKQTVIQQNNTNVVVMDEETLNRIDETIQLIKNLKLIPSVEVAGKVAI